MTEPTREQLVRGMTALHPFVITYNLPLNPEDMEEVVYAVLKHAGGLGPLEQITGAVEQQIVSAVSAHTAMVESMHRQSTDRVPKPPSA